MRGKPYVSFVHDVAAAFPSVAFIMKGGACREIPCHVVSSCAAGGRTKDSTACRADTLANSEQTEERYGKGKHNRRSRQQCCLSLCHDRLANPDQHIHDCTVQRGRPLQQCTR